MTDIAQRIRTKAAVKTVNRSLQPVSTSQKKQDTQAGGPTIGGVAGVGKQKTATRPKSSQSTKTPSPHGVRTGPIGEAVHDDAWFHKKAIETAKGMGWPAHLVHKIKANMIKDHENDKLQRAAERAAKKKTVKEGRENEYTANRQLQHAVKAKMQNKLQPKGGDDYFSYQASKKAPEKKTMKEEAPAMSVGSGGAVSTITNPTVNYAFQIKKKIKDKVKK